MTNRFFSKVMGITAGVLLGGLACWFLVPHAWRQPASGKVSPTGRRGDTSGPSPAVRLEANRTRLAFGQSLALTIRIGSPASGALRIDSLVERPERVRLIAEKEGRKVAFLGSDRRGLPRTITLERTGLVLVYPEVTCVPGRVEFYFEFDAEKTRLASNRVVVEVAPPASHEEAVAAYVAVFRHYATEDYYMPNRGYVPGLQPLSLAMPGAAIEGLRKILSSPETESPPWVREVAIPILGSLANPKLATYVGFERTTLAPEVLAELVANEHRFRVIYKYLTIMPFYADVIVSAHTVRFGDLLKKLRQAPDEDVASQAYSRLMDPRFRGLTDLKKEDLLAEIEASKVLSEVPKNSLKRAAALPDSAWLAVTGEP